jgi:hypothetical protein
MSAGQFPSGRKGGGPWPTAAQFNEAIQNLHTSMSDAELQDGTAAVNTLGLPMLYSGGFADVYQVHCGATGNTWAVKCFTKGASGLHERYDEISRCLARARLTLAIRSARGPPASCRTFQASCDLALREWRVGNWSPRMDQLLWDWKTITCSNYNVGSSGPA